MFKWALLLSLLWATPVWAQNPTCPTRPPGDSSNSCASTAFVNTPATGGTFTPNQPVIGGPSGGLAQGTRNGNTTAYPTNDAVPVTGECAVADSVGGLIYQACSPSGSGTVGAGLTGNLAIYPSNGTSVVGTSASQLLTARSVGADMSGTLFNQILTGTNTIPTGPGASGDLTTSIQTTISTVSAQGGGTVFFPAAVGAYWVCDLTVPANIRLEGAPLGSKIEATANCPQGPILSASATGTGDAWIDIRRMLNSIASAGATAIVVNGTTTDVSTGDLILLQDDKGIFVEFVAGTVSQNTPSSGLTTINIGTCYSGCTAGGLTNQATNGNPWRDLGTGPDDVAVSNISMFGLEIDGNLLNQSQSYGGNVAHATTPTIGSVSLNGNLVPPNQSRAYIDFGSNLPIKVCTTTTETASVTITGYRQNADYSYTSISQTLSSLPSNGCTQTDYNHWMREVSSVSVGGANFVGNLSVGAPDGATSSPCLTLSAPFFRLQDVQFQHCMGFGIVSNWTAGGGGFNSVYATQQAYMTNVDVEITYGGGVWMNGPNDSKLNRVEANFLENIGMWFDRNCGGCTLSDGHFSGGVAGASYNNGGFMQPVYMYLLDGPSIELEGSKGEEASRAQVMMRASSDTITGGQFFAPQIAAIAPGGEQSFCFFIGDPNYNQASSDSISQYNIRSNCQNPGGGGLYMGADNGAGYIYLTGADFATTTTSALTAASTAVSLACGACSGSISGTMSMVLALNSGIASVTVGPYNATLNQHCTGAAGSWCIVGVTGNANSGNTLYRAQSIENLSEPAGFLSDIRLNMPVGFYQGHFNQAAF